MPTRPGVQLPIKIFSGSVADGGFRLLHASFPPKDWRTRVFTDSMTPVCWIIEYVISGWGFLAMPPFDYHPGPGDLYLLPKQGQPYSYHSDLVDPWSKACFLVDGPLVERLIDAYGLRGGRLFSGCEDLRWIFEKIYALKNTREDSQFEALVLVNVLFNALRGRNAESKETPSDAGEDDLAARLRAYLNDGVESDVSVGAFCLAAKANKSSLTRTFHRRYGMAPYAYLMTCRLERSKSFLKFSAMSIKEIAARLRFTDQYHFSNYFKRKAGLSPSAYKAKVDT